MCTCVLLRSTCLMILLICLDPTLAQWSSSGESQSFTCVTTRRQGSIFWQLQSEQYNTTLFICQANNCDPIDNNVLDKYSARNLSNSIFTITVLTIKYITPSQHNTKWLCKQNMQENLLLITQYDLKVFAPAIRPTCDTVTLLKGSSIEITCLTDKVFPESMCEFYINDNSSEYILNQGFIRYKQEQNLTTLYYKTTCTMVVSAAILGPGTHMFRVVMYPNITSNITEEMKSTSGNMRSIYLAYPKVVLGTDCAVKGYIKENETSICTCYDKSISFLPTQIKWSSNQSVILDRGAMIFTAKRKVLFQCTISNYLNWTDTIVFQPNISYPPDTVRLNITKQVFDSCNDTYIAISGTCFVSDSNPEPIITLNINKSSMDITSLKLNREYMFNSVMTATGIFHFSCNANSMDYSKNASSITTTVTINGPPDIPTIFKNENNEIISQPKHLLEITKDDTITCQVKGGYPIFKNISLRCGPEETRATNQDQVSLALNISKVSNGTCQCIVQHESVCLQNTSTVQFKVIAISIDDSTADQLSDGAISGIVIAGMLVLALIALIIFLAKRYKGQRLNNPRRQNKNETNDYDHMSAAQYVNTEMHPYETSRIETSYVNALPASANSSDLPKISLEQAATQYINTEMDTHETGDVNRIYLNESSITDIVNGIDHHEYDTVNDQVENC